jgi:hypothetical protein
MKKLTTLLFLAFVWQWLRYAATKCQYCPTGRMIPSAGTMRRLSGQTPNLICDCCHR